MAHTRAIDWTDPADTDIVNGGALEIRDLKQDIEERMDLDHYWAVELDTSVAGGDGYHKKITLKNYTDLLFTNEGTVLYTKETDGKVVPYYFDEDGNEVNFLPEFFYDCLKSQTVIYAEGTGTGTSTPVAFTEIIDANNDFSGNTFTCPMTGKYLFSIAGAYTTYIYKNGLSYITITDPWISYISIPLNLVAGDAITIRGSGTIYFMSIFRMWT